MKSSSTVYCRCGATLKTFQAWDRHVEAMERKWDSRKRKLVNTLRDIESRLIDLDVKEKIDCRAWMKIDGMLSGLLLDLGEGEHVGRWIPWKTRTVRTMEEARRMKEGETARCAIPLKMVVVDDHRCPTCRFTFSSEKTPKFCPGCGGRWNGRVPSKAMAESE